MTLPALLVVAMLCAVVLGIALYSSSPREPVYQGKTLSAWIEPFCRQTRTGWNAPLGPASFAELQPTRRAVSEMGTNALPFLIARLEHREPALHRKLRLFLAAHPFAGIRLEDPALKQIRAIRALAVLGSAAQPAIPDLVAQLTNRPVSQHAQYALEAAGTNGVRALLDQLTNNDALVRMEIANRFIGYSSSSWDWGGAAGNFGTNDGAREVIISGLTLLAQTTNAPYRIPALTRLGRFGPAASNAVPPLLLMLNDGGTWRKFAIEAIGKIHARPDVAIPALIDQLKDLDAPCRMAAISALRAYGSDGVRALADQLTNNEAPARGEIASSFISYSKAFGWPGTAGNFGTDDSTREVIVSGLTRLAQDSSSPYGDGALMRLGAFGPAASSAVPALVLLLDEQPLRRVRVMLALRAIHARPDLVIPALSNHLNDPDVSIRLTATSTLRAYGYEAAYPQPEPPRSPVPPTNSSPSSTTNLNMHAPDAPKPRRFSESN